MTNRKKKISYPTDIKALVIKADPEWPKKSVQVPQYRFGQSNAPREFTQTIRPGQAYSWV